MPDDDPLRRALRRATEAAPSLPDEIDAVDLRTNPELSTFMGAAVITGARAVQTFPAAHPQRDLWTVRYCASLGGCRRELVSAHSLNADTLDDLLARALAAAREHRRDDQLMLRLSLDRLASMIAAWGAGLPPGDEHGYNKVAVALSQAEGMAVTALAMRLDAAGA